MATAELDTSRISDWDSFHSECARALGFPTFYGGNMNAFIDCLTYLDEGDGMSRFHLSGEERLEILLIGAQDLTRRFPNGITALIESVASINLRYVERGKNPAVVLVPS